MDPKITQEDRVPACYAQRSPMECDRAPDWCFETSAGRYYACEKHRRLVSMLLERRSLEPHLCAV